MRRSTDQHDDQGNLVNGFDYDLQVWVKGGIIQDCGHPERMRPGCCNADLLKGREIAKARKERNL
jgi:hypothetical protein